jgi:REP element-mobilizing transposase RayT
MTYFGENWDEAEFPLAYLITIRTRGTWLHGDERFSVDTHDGLNIFGTPKRPKNSNLTKVMSAKMTDPPFRLNKQQRRVVMAAIEEVCRVRDYTLHALSVRSNHAHVVVRAPVRPENIANTFKAYATRKLRESSLIDDTVRPWSRGRSRRYLWKPNHLDGAIDYVMFCQSDHPFEEWFGSKYDV